MIVYKNNNRYAFRIGKFDSSIGYFIFPHVKSSYACAWQAERDGRKILKTMRTILAEETDAEESAPFVPDQHQSAETMIVSHYLSAYDALVDKADGIKGEDDETLKKVYEEIKIVVTNLLKVKEGVDDKESKNKISEIIGKFSRLTKSEFNDFLQKDREASSPDSEMPPPEMPPSMPPPTANALHRYLFSSATEVLSDSEEHEILEDSAQKACAALEPKLPDAVYMIDTKKRNIVLASNDRKIKYVTLMFDKDLLLSQVLPHSFLPSSNSGDFYQNIFKPIFESIGHYKLASKGVLLVNGKTYLPDLQEADASFDIDAIDTETKTPCATTISFSKKRWKTGGKINRTAQQVSRYTEMDYVANGGALVRCTDSELPSIFGRTGTVKEVIPTKSRVYVDVDFGHAIVRLTENQIEIISDDIQDTA